jgi:L-fuculokinase
MPLVAVIDLGKTNKKVALVDERLRLVAVRKASIGAAPAVDGILAEQTEAIWDFICQALRELGREHPIAAISVTTHGATFALIGGDGLTAPVVAYEHDPGAPLDADYYARCGTLAAQQAETGTCDLPLLINPSKALFYIQQRRPDALAAARHLLWYPQFWGWKLTGAVAVEPTYAFNHAFLYDIRNRRPSAAARTLGVDRLLDLPMRRPWDRLGTLSPEVQRRTGLGSLPVTVGIHDSNAALLPYLVAKQGRDFCVDSTGTWCVAMHRVDRVDYAADEIGQKVLFNVDALGSLTKVSFLMGGLDYQLYHGLIGGSDPAFDAARVDAALARTGDAILPGANASQFPRCHGGALDDGRVVPLADLHAGRTPAWFADQALAHDLLNASLALQSAVAIARTGTGPGATIYVEGGFRNNPVFLAILAALLPDNPVVLTSLAEATSSGTALLGHALLAGTDPTAFADRIAIDEVPVTAPRLARLPAYAAAWRAAAG